MYIPESIIAKIKQYPETEYRNVQIEKELTPFYFPEDRFYPPVSLTQAESETIARLYVTVKGYMDQMLADFIVNGNVDARWDGYIKTLESMGFRDLEAAYQAAHDRFVKG
jgi:putative aldouronate transport system substrate-binding protein